MSATATNWAVDAAITPTGVVVDVPVFPTRYAQHPNPSVWDVDTWDADPYQLRLAGGDRRRTPRYFHLSYRGPDAAQRLVDQGPQVTGVAYAFANPVGLAITADPRASTAYERAFLAEHDLIIDVGVGDRLRFWTGAVAREEFVIVPANNDNITLALPGQCRMSGRWGWSDHMPTPENRPKNTPIDWVCNCGTRMTLRTDRRGAVGVPVHTTPDAYDSRGHGRDRR